MPTYRHPHKKIQPTKIALGLGFVLFIIYLFRSWGGDEETDVFNAKLESLYNPDTPKPIINNKKGNKPEIAIVDKDYEERVKRPKHKAKSPSHFSSKCENYIDYSKEFHEPFSQGQLELPFQRPPERCRTFQSPAVEKLINDLKIRIADPDLARLVENTLPNTLDTTVLWHKVKSSDTKYSQSFIVTGDIHAEWLRDAARQLSVYQNLTNYDDKLKELIRGAINTQASYILVSPYCNAFHPPAGSGIKKGDTAFDKVTPQPHWKYVFECKWEVDSLASFLTLTNEYYANTKDVSIFNELWIKAIGNILTVLKRESSPTFDSNGRVLPFYYTFQRDTNIGTETLPLAGTGNPVNFDIGLIRSAFRPSDDATIFQYFIPGNAHLSVELGKISETLTSLKDQLNEFEDISTIINLSKEYSDKIKKSIYEHAVFTHPEFGKVFAYEIDGYGGRTFMDDANIPSLLSLPDLGFLDKSDEIYQNTRKMILTKRGNPYYLQGKYFRGIGGPHIGIHNAWPMSLLLQIRTSDDDVEISENLDFVLRTTAGLGLIHESIQVNYPDGYKYTRPWFSWANSEFGKTILDVAQRKPHLIFKDEYKNKPYSLSNFEL